MLVILKRPLRAQCFRGLGTRDVATLDAVRTGRLSFRRCLSWLEAMCGYCIPNVERGQILANFERPCVGLTRFGHDRLDVRRRRSRGAERRYVRVDSKLGMRAGITP
jgi:hypothetical protein